MSQSPVRPCAVDRAGGYSDLLDHFTAWAATQSDIRAALVIGSRARADHPADEWSDLDIIVFTREPDRFIASADWVRQVGEPVLTFVERTPGDGWERRVLFAGGLDVDFAINPAQWLEHLSADRLPPDTIDLLRRGTRAVVDKDGHLANLAQQPLPARVPFQPPGEAAFLGVVNDFWYHALWSARHMRRGELWWAKSGLDMRLKGLLAQMLEWHAHATRGSDCDTWMRGRFLEEWADPRAVQALPRAFAHYDQADFGRALLVTMELFRWLAIETARKWKYNYPFAGDQLATELTQQLLPERERLPAI